MAYIKGKQILFSPKIIFNGGYDEGFKDGQLDVISNATALQGNASGVAFAITDISPIEHILRVKARSKNFIQVTSAKLPEDNLKILFQGDVVGDFVFSFTNNLTEPTTPNSAFVRFTIDGAEKNISVERSQNYVFSGRLTEIKILNWCDATGNIDNIQLEIGTVATPYTPYIDVSTAKVQRYRKSLFDFEYKVMQAGIHRIDSRNMLIPIQNQVFAFSIDKLPAEIGLHIEYADGSVKPLTIGYGSVKYFFKFDGEVLRFGNNSSCGATKNLDGKVKRFGFWAYGQDSAGWDTEPLAQVELNTEPTEYEPYTEPTTYPISTDGTVEGVTSVYPTTTLIPDTEGITITCDYYKDIDKAFNEQITNIALTGGN